MEKCHCSGVSFEEIADKTKKTGCDFRNVAKEMGAADTCTACKPYLNAYCEEKLGLSLAGN